MTIHRRKHDEKIVKKQSKNSQKIVKPTFGIVRLTIFHTRCSWKIIGLTILEIRQLLEDSRLEYFGKQTTRKDSGLKYFGKQTAPEDREIEYLGKQAQHHPCSVAVLPVERE